MLKKFLVFAALLLASPALAQNVQYVSPVTRNHIPVWNTNGVIADGGSSADSPISSLGVTNEGGAGFCISSQRQTAPGRNQLCFGVSTAAAATVTLQNFGNAASQNLNFVVNGITYPFPGALSQITINTTPVVGGANGNCLFVNGTTVGMQTCAASSITQLTGDVTAIGPNSVPATLATVNGNVGVFGSASVVPLVTVNGKGLITAISNTTISISANSQLTGPTLSGAITASSLTSVGTIGTGVWQGTLISPTFGGTGVNNGSSTLTLATNFVTTGTGTPTLNFAAGAFTYSFQNSSDTIVGRATTDTLTNKTLTTPTINGAALSGTLSGTPTLSGANFVTNANIVQAAAATFIGNPTASLANQTAFTISGLTDITTPSSTLDLIPIFNHTTGTLQKTNANELITAAGGGVTSIAGNAGAFTLNGASGLTNTVNDIKCSQATSAQFGCIEVDNVTITATTGVIKTVNPLPAQIANSLSGDVLMNNTANYFDGPSIAQGTSGTWWVSGTVSVTDTAGAGQMQCKLWDGTTVISSAVLSTSGINSIGTLSLHGFLVSPAANIKISCKDVTSTSGKMFFNQTGNSKDSTVSAHRIQ